MIESRRLWYDGKTDDRIKELRSQGLSYENISRSLGNGITKGMVLNRCRNLGVAPWSDKARKRPAGAAAFGRVKKEEPPTPEFTPDENDLLRKMVGDGKHINAIRTRIWMLTGRWRRDFEIVAGAADIGLRVRARGPQPGLDVADLDGTMRRIPDRVRFVAPGSYPASGFSMLGGRVR